MSNSTGTNLENRISNENLVRRIQNGEETAANMAQLWQQTKGIHCDDSKEIYWIC